MVIKRIWKPLVALLLVAPACSGSTGETDATAVTDDVAAVPATTSATVVETLPAADSDAAAATTAPTTTTGIAPGVAALTSGRGDDGSLEVGIWFNSDPFAAGLLRLRVGTDSDDSYPGVGDPEPHIDAWAEVSAEGVVLSDGGTVVADDLGGGLGEWLTWTGPGRTVWFYFIGNVPVRAGSVWVVAEINGAAGVGSIAGAPMGEGCSYHGSGIDLGDVPGDVPQPGSPCRYP